MPIIAAVNGPAVGLGCSLASMSDIVLVEEQAYFSDPHVMLGLVAGDGGAVMWPLLTSLLRAKEYIFLGDRLPAEEAVRVGIANRVVPSGTSVAAALELADRIAALPTAGRPGDQGAAESQRERRGGGAADDRDHHRDRVVRRAGVSANLGRMLGRSAEG